LAIFNHQNDVEPLIKKLRSAGFQKIYTFGELHEFLDLPPVFWLGKRSDVQKCKSDILRAFDCMADEKSRAIFCDHIGLRLGFRPGSLASPDRRNQYAPADISGLNPQRLIDGGAFDGDTLRTLLKKHRRLDSVAAFEPDLDNFRKLVKTAATRRKEILEVMLFPAGLGDKIGNAEFAGGKGAGSKLSEQGGSTVPVVALDDVLPNFSPTFIKLDIEGSELSALRGARGLITYHKPCLAVCVYHMPKDLWEIPLIVKSMLPNHRLRMRCHGYNGLELVLYASSK
jgi:FkbM family methyltransferase